MCCFACHRLQVQHLIAELNEILANDVVDEGGLWKKKLAPQTLELFELLPPAIQDQLMLERDPHGNVQVYISLLPSEFVVLIFAEQHAYYHVSTSRSPKLKQKKCSSKWLRQNWSSANRRIYIRANSKDNPIFSGI